MPDQVRNVEDLVLKLQLLKLLKVSFHLELAWIKIGLLMMDSLLFDCVQLWSHIVLKLTLCLLQQLKILLAYLFRFVISFSL